MGIEGFNALFAQEGEDLEAAYGRIGEVADSLARFFCVYRGDLAGVSVLDVPENCALLRLGLIGPDGERGMVVTDQGREFFLNLEFLLKGSGA